VRNVREDSTPVTRVMRYSLAEYAGAGTISIRIEPGMTTFGATWSRIAQMGAEERWARLTQEITKRVDLFFYRTGLRLRKNALRTGAVSRGSFFFSPDELPNLVALFRERLGSEVENVIREADHVCQHRFRLLGYDALNYGSQIDWHLDIVHDKRAPMKPWFKINFLDFEEVGDHKIIWELSRHQHLVTLAKAWCLSSQERYVMELQDQWYSWQRANPYPMGINWGSSLEVAFRSLSWLWVLALLSECPAVEATFRNDVSRALALNGRHIERYLSTYFSPNTHLLGEAVGLFFIGTMCPEIAAAGRWRKHGWCILVDEAKRQVRSDGVYFEQSLYYHVYALDFLLHARILAAHNGIDVTPDFNAVLQKMLDVLHAVSQAGALEGFGDDDGGRVFSARRNQAEHMTDPLALGGILFRRDDLKSTARLTEEAIWLFGGQANSYFDKAANAGSKLEAASFNAGGIYVMASDKQYPMQMIIDAGPQGTGRSGHGHADALSIRVAIAGRRWLVDPGTLCYICEERDHFRGTRSHNTLRIDGYDQAISDGPFAWRSIPDVRCERWIEGEGFTLFAGSHTGYMRLPDPVLHRRHIFYLHDDLWLVRDVVEGHQRHRIEIHWHFASDLALEIIANGFVASSKEPSSANVVHLAVLPVEQSGWTSTIEADSLSPAYGRKSQAPTLRLGSDTQLSTEHATLLLPCTAPQEMGKLSLFKDKSASAYWFEGRGKTHYMIFADPKAETWTWNEWTSNAGFLYFSLEAGCVASLIFCEGSEVRFKGSPVMAHSSKLARFEWTRNTGQTFSSDDSAAHSMSAEALESSGRVAK
jgi:hypothetical protein